MPTCGLYHTVLGTCSGYCVSWKRKNGRRRDGLRPEVMIAEVCTLICFSFAERNQLFGGEMQRRFSTSVAITFLMQEMWSRVLSLYRLLYQHAYLTAKTMFCNVRRDLSDEVILWMAGHRSLVSL